MSYDAARLTFKEPTRTDVALTPELAKTIHHFQKQRREGLFHLCMIAYGLRRHNLSIVRGTRGGNAREQHYKPQFKEWYEKNKITAVYGELPNFTLYAMSGRLLSYVRWQLSEDYIEKLPASLGALYACSQILFTQGEQITTKGKKHFSDALLKPVRDGSANPHLIHPQVTRKEIESYRAKLDTKLSAKRDEKQAANNAELKDAPFILGVLRVHKDLIQFSKRGNKTGVVDLKHVIAFLDELKKLIDKHKGTKNRFVFESCFANLKKEYESARSPDFGAALRK